LQPHHITFSYDKQTLAGAGIFSFLWPLSARIPLQEQVFFFDTRNPRSPTFNGVTSNPLRSGAADELYPLSDGTFILSSLSTRAGTSEGAITHLAADGTILGEYPLVPPIESFDPHGITVREDLDLFITTGKALFVNLFDFKVIKRSCKETFSLMLDRWWVQRAWNKGLVLAI
jgi:hypothetical protein